jgi:hypothetical protein
MVAALAATALIVPSQALSITNRNAKEGLPNIDSRVGTIAPTAEQKAIVSALGAKARWNRFGTPSSLIKYGGLLASGLSGSNVEAARSWIRANKVLFRLTDAEVTNLELVSESPIRGTAGRAVIFGQRFGALSAGQEGLITVGVNKGRIFYVSSTAAGGQGTPAPATLTPSQAWLKAAESVGRSVSVLNVSNIRSQDGWTVFSVKGFETPLRTGVKTHGTVDQRARLVAVPTPSGAKAAYHTLVIDNEPGKELGYEAFVDARTGEIIMRYNRFANFHAGHRGGVLAMPRAGTFTGQTNVEVAGPDCGPQHEFQVDAQNRTIDIAAQALTANDIVLRLLDPADTVVASSDTPVAQSPEAVHYAIPQPTPVGMWAAQVCEFADEPPVSYAGTFAVGDVDPTTAGIPTPAWRLFGINPPLGDSTPPFDYDDTDDRLSACWDAPGGLEPAVTPACDTYLLEAGEAGSPWDFVVQANSPTFTTIGNNAVTAESWTSNPVLSQPAPFQQRPLDVDRTYGYADSSQSATPESWTNQWNTQLCNPATTFTSLQANDIMASTTHLFGAHNRHHDWTYQLGFTEENFNAQAYNFGRGGMEGDPEIGDAQAGALATARNNANQLIVPDGVPGLTNQYLFQPLLGFWTPCADGGYDNVIVGHEYGHLVNNRMVGGPMSSMSSTQGGAMSESWGDQNGLEFGHEYGYLPVGSENPWAAGAYATGALETGIRNYALNASPLQFGDLGYDYIGDEIHSDGEPWSAVNFDIRQALVNKYNATFPASNTTLQRECADGHRPSYLCPGNRRWIQIQYDAYLLMPSTVGMLEALDAYLAADVNRNLSHGSTNWPSNQTELWGAMAGRGFGLSAVSGSNATDPTPAYDSPNHTEATVTFQTPSGDGGPAPQADIYIGHYEARITPIADTKSATTLDNVEQFVPGTYTLHIRANGYGHIRRTMTLTAGQVVTLPFPMVRNWASTTNGGSATSTAVGSANPGSLIDDTEGTTWDVVDGADYHGAVPILPDITVDLGGGTHTVELVKVSAMVSPGESGQSSVRRFRLEACEAGVPTILNTCGPNGIFTTIYTSPANTAPGCGLLPICPATSIPFDAGTPFVGAPALLWRAIDVDPTDATHVRLTILDNQCSGTPEYQGEQDADPANWTDCDGFDEDGDGAELTQLLVSNAYNDGRVAELQVFESDTP